MKYDLDETLRIVMERKREAQRKQERRRMIVANMLTFIFSGAVIAMIAFRTTGVSKGVESDFFGGYMLSPEIGGYVLVALLAFAAGLFAMIAINHYKKIQGMEGQEKGTDNEKDS